MKIRDYLLLFRVHTAGLTQGAVLLGLLLAGVSLLSWDTLFWCVWAVLFHATGFLYNNLADYEHDLKDPAKKSHPLISGKVDIHIAYHIDIALHAFLLLMGVLLTDGKLLPTFFLVICVVTGWLYNWTCKRSLVAPAFISISFGFLLLISYLTYADGFTPLVVVVTAYAISQMFFQIAVEGYLKDIEHDPVNLLRELGVRIRRGRLRMSIGGIVFSFSSKMATYLSGICLTVYIGGFFSLMVFILGMTVQNSIFFKLAQPAWDRKKVVRNCALMEIVTYFTLIWILFPVVGLWESIVMTLYPMAWFVVWNKMYWGTSIRPKV